MRPDGGRTKKLIVAFHFQFANRAAWKCETCRKSGLERRRRCGWLDLEGEPGGRPVWARRGVAAEICPVSYITGQSLAWIEQYGVWKMLRAPMIEELPARTVEAFWLLEGEMAKEAIDGER